MGGSSNHIAYLTLLAEQERDDIIDWYATIDFTIANKWLNEFDQLVERLEHNPFMYAEHLLFILKAKLNSFPYHVFYAIDSVNFRVEIIGIQHSNRDPDLMRRRINF